jgi:Ulp1 family protease
MRGLQPHNAVHHLRDDEEGIMSEKTVDAQQVLRESLAEVIERGPREVGVVIHHKGGVGHWTLGTLKLEGGKVYIEHYDSLGMGLSRSDSKALRFLAAEVFGASLRVVEEEVFGRGSSKGIPSPQVNAVDCGVFVCIFAWLKSMGAPKGVIGSMTRLYGKEAVPNMRKFLHHSLEGCVAR